jgi:V/A-type H+-transporting ATPase subunit F
MYKIAVIGDRSSVLGFQAVGLSVFPVMNSYEARSALHDATQSGFAIIFITEGVLESIIEDVEKYQDYRIPAIIPIPGMDGNNGIGLSNVKKSVERAVGADILFNND